MARSGFGSISPFRGSGFRATITIAGRREQRVFPKRGLAREWLRVKALEKVRVEAGAQPRASAETVTVRELIPELKRWYRSRPDLRYSDRTLASYDSELVRVEARFGSRRLSRLTDRDIRAWVEEMRGAGVSSSTQRHLLQRLRQLIDLAVRDKLIAAPPVAIRPPRLRAKTAPRRLSEHEAARLVAAAAAAFDRRAVPAVLLGTDAGLRASEIAQLRVGDVDLERDELRVESRGEGDRTKSGGYRVVPIRTPRLRRALRGICAGRERDDRVLGVSTRDGLYGIVAPAWRAAGLDGAPQLHAARRRFARWEADRGTPLHHVQAWLGHATILTTMLYVGKVEGTEGVRRTRVPRGGRVSR